MSVGKKVLTISIAAYNVESHLAATLDSLLIDDLDMLEILIVNDGSVDDTKEIAMSYQKKYPGVVKVIDKKNGGYGSTINAGIKKATGKYFKQLDGDDKYNTENLQRLCERLKTIDCDAVYAPYVEENCRTNKAEKHAIKGSNTCKTVNASGIGFEDEFFHMHALAYKTDLLKKNNIKIDEKCFYTDTEYVVLPLVYVKDVFIFNKPIYRYRTGDEQQSMSVKSRLKHYDDHIKMLDRLLLVSQTDDFIKSPLCEQLRQYIITIIINDIVMFKVDTLKMSRKSYKKIAERIKSLRKTNGSLFEEAKKRSRGIKNIAEKGYLGYCMVKLKRLLF